MSLKIFIFIYLIVYCNYGKSSRANNQFTNIDDDWSNEDQTYIEKEFEENDFKFDETNSIKDSDEKPELYEFWNNLDMCNNVHCKSNQYCKINENKVVTCVPKKNTIKAKLNCEPCTISTSEFLCSSRNKTFSSTCRLSYYNCLHSTNDYPVCEGMCPCKKDYQIKKKEISFNVWKNFQKFNLLKSNFLSSSKKNVCSQKELDEIGQRLFNWFRIILKNQSIRNTKFNNLINKIRSSIFECNEEVNWMFFNLDINKDLKLSIDELYDLEHDQKEKCLKQYIDKCDTNQDHLLNNNEWCNCFEQFKPCIKKQNDIKLDTKLFNVFIPKCDKYGNYEPLQCNQLTGFCWCVDKNGVEVANSKKYGKIDCENNKYAQLDDDTENDGDDDSEDYQSETEGSGA